MPQAHSLGENCRMKIYFNFPEKPVPCVLTIGAFDGLHKGHKKILQKVKTLSQKHKLPSVAITFHPHPRQILNPGSAPRLLTVLSEKIYFLSQCGIDIMVVLPFTKVFSKTTAEIFIKDMLLRAFQPREFITGYDFSFGKDRHGSLATIKKFSRFHGKGYHVHVIPPFKLKNEIISSTRIRRLIESSNVTDAARCLGHPYFLFGKVIEGEKRGKTLGFPTANLRFSDEKLLPGNGVYSVRVKVLPDSFKNLHLSPDKIKLFHSQHNAPAFTGVANLGMRPTFKERMPTFEVHILDMRRNLYGKMLCVEFIQYLRPEKMFKNAEELKKQIQKDIQRTRNISSAGKRQPS